MRTMAEWFDQGAMMTKQVGNISYEIWSNGTFACTSPDGDRFKGHDSAADWLVARGITNDEELLAMATDEKEGWTCDMNRWFELIVFEIQEKDGLNHMTELYCGEPFFEWDEETAKIIIEEAIENDKEVNA